MSAIWGYIDMDPSVNNGDCISDIKTKMTKAYDGFVIDRFEEASFSGGFYKRITNTFNNITDNIWLIGQPSTTNTVNVTSTSTWTDRQTYEYNSSHFPQKITSYTGDGYRKVSEETYAYDATAM